MPKRVLITGSNRGIGLEFVRQYLENGWIVYATCRRPAEANALHMFAELFSELHIYPLDVTVREDIMDMRLELKNIPLDLLINNAGVYFEKANTGLETIHYDDWLRTIEVNTIGPVRITAAFLDNIAASDRKLVAVISSHTGNNVDTAEINGYYYRSSKAALNTAMQDIAVLLRKRGIGILLLNPGEVMTRIGPTTGITARQSVAGMRRIIENFTLNQSGTLQRYDNRETTRTAG